MLEEVIESRILKLLQQLIIGLGDCVKQRRNRRRKE
jgi:hypothetical protein